MSDATDMLAIAKARYERAKQEELEFASGGGRRRTRSFDLTALRADYLYWAKQVEIEALRASGQPGRKPFQVVL